ncbi:YopX family protein [Bacillus velezensis]
MNTAYRVWDGEQMHYWDDEGLSLNIEDGNWYLYSKGKFITSNKTACAALMWGTGLKDKKGRMVYEGDCFTAEHKSVKVYKGLVKHDLSFVFKIEDFERIFIHGVGTVGTSRTFSIYSFVEWFADVNVIGNIYENPELLEGLE